MTTRHEASGRAKMALIVGATLREGPVRLALQHAGYEVRDVFSTDQAEACIEIRGIGSCLLALDARALDEREGSATWRTLMDLYPDLAAVIVAWTGMPPRAREAASGARRVLVEEYRVPLC